MSNALIVALLALSCASPGVQKVSLLFSFFNGSDFASNCNLASIESWKQFWKLKTVLKAFSSAFHIPSNLQPQLHLGKLFVTFLYSSNQIIDSTLKRTMTYTNLWIIYNAGIALCACVKQKINYIFKIYKFLIFESRTVKLLVLNMNIIFLKIFRD